ncbi:MAG: shikimate kinase [Bacteroidales bacterium]|nr:shikimate kinase [Bacteroidales bacterium]MDD4215199.1 shikimate kinase [Bacteroidales bacterium]
MKIFLIGFMGSGKTVTGRLLADKLTYNFYDTDEMLEKQFLCSIYDCFDKYGEDTFRKAEHKLLLQLIASNENAVIACGGGLACHQNNMGIMNRKGITVYLKYSQNILYKRIENTKHIRPLLTKQSDLKVFVSNLLSERSKYYEKAKYVIEAGENETVDEIVKKILKRMKGNFDGE